MKKSIYDAKVLSNTIMAPDVKKIIISAPEVASEAAPGQFVNFYPAADRLILPRPISISDADSQAGTICLVYAVVGQGTDELARVSEGESVRISSPLGHGFDTEKLSEGDTAVLIGGGIGTAPMVFLARELDRKGVKCTAVVGFKKNPLFQPELGEKKCRVLVTTDLPSENAFLGTVVDCMKINDLDADAWFACGPKPMLRAVCEYAYSRDEKTDVQVSMESRMGCGYGACVGCVCDIKDPENEGGIVKKKVCKDGPVFDGNEVAW